MEQPRPLVDRPRERFGSDVALDAEYVVVLAIERRQVRRTSRAEVGLLGPRGAAGAAPATSTFRRRRPSGTPDFSTLRPGATRWTSPVAARRATTRWSG